MITGIILAGGKSSRLGINKMLLPLAGLPLIDHTISALETAVDRIIVVTGRFHHELSEHLVSKPDLLVVFNNDYEQGMFTSIKTGVKEVDGNFYVIPGDYPLVSPETYETLKKESGMIRVPVYYGRRGHPIYFDGSFKNLLLEEPDTSNLKSFRDRYQVNYVDVFDEGVVFDVDTFQDLEAIEQLMLRRTAN